MFSVHKLFSVYTTPEEFEKHSVGELHDYNKAIVLEKVCFRNVFRLHKIENPAFSNSSNLKSVFEKLRFRDGLV